MQMREEGRNTGENRTEEHQRLWNKGQALNFTLFHNSFLGNWDLSLRQVQAVDLIHPGLLFHSPESNCMIISTME